MRWEQGGTGDGYSTGGGWGNGEGEGSGHPGGCGRGDGEGDGWHGNGADVERGGGWASPDFCDGLGNGVGERCGDGHGEWGPWRTVLGAPEELEEHPLKACRWVLYPNQREQIMGIIALREVTL